MESGGSATHCITMATTALKFIACWDSSSKCVYICVFVWKNAYFSGCCCRMCLCFLLRVQLFPISRRQMLLPFSFAVANLRNLAWSSSLFSLSFPHSFLNAPSSNQWVREQGPLGRTAPLPKKGIFNLSPPWPLLPFSLMPHATFLLLVILH